MIRAVLQVYSRPRGYGHVIALQSVSLTVALSRVCGGLEARRQWQANDTRYSGGHSVYA